MRLTKYCDEGKKNRVGGACSRFGKEEKCVYGFIGVDERTILKLSLNSLVGRTWTESSWLRIGTDGGLF